MKVRDAMTNDVFVANPEHTIAHAAKVMADIDCGAIPVGENDRLVGMITDRDIAIRAVAEGKGPDTRVREVMSSDIKYCFDHEEIDNAARNMGDQQIRRLPVIDRNKRLVGILSLGDLALSRENGSANEALAGISRPGGAHSQSADSHAV
ncbi:CBS domain-containing protein [Hyphomicrobium sp. CS1GBMeth3]|uniref:CBS domain-containing protein n=1 Tax=Hyphomicrobium sp. CS1GBMeth3 TaxID=1892845 RepID=UPI000931D94C|nr:CBS domain-containing protein [Hyphomicrobium sp. CS1GBMeth3]